jgi:hypothetical protein
VPIFLHWPLQISYFDFEPARHCVLKKLILTLINKIFGLNLTEVELDAVIAFVKMLIGLFGKQEAMAYMSKTTRKAKVLGRDQAKAKFEKLDRTLDD